MTSQLDFHGPNVGYILELYDIYRETPENLDETTRDFLVSGHRQQPQIGKWQLYRLIQLLTPPRSLAQ